MEYVIAEDVAEWVCENRAKKSFERVFGDLTPAGREVARRALQAIRDLFPVIDYSYTTIDNGMPWTERQHTFVSTPSYIEADMVRAAALGIFEETTHE
jgi:hypothetical protein